MRRCVVVIRRKPGRIGEMRARAAQSRSPVIHHLGKPFHRTAYIFRKRVGRIIGRLQHQRIQRVTDRHLLPFRQSHIRRVFIQLIDNGGTGHHGIKIRILQCEETGQDLGDRCRIQLTVTVLGIQKDTRINIHNDTCRRLDRLTFRPSLHGIRLNRLIIFIRDILFFVCTDTADRSGRKQYCHNQADKSARAAG